MIPEALRRAGSLVAIAAAPALAHAQATGDVQADSFQAAWRIVHETHFDTTFNGVNWVALGDSLRPLAAGASRDRVRGLIAGMLARLDQSHFSLIPAEHADAPAGLGGGATAGLDIRFLDGRVVVTAVDHGGPAEQAGIRPGWVLEAVDTVVVTALVERIRGRRARYHEGARVWSQVRALLSGPEGGSVTLALRDGDDAPVTRTLTLRPDPSLPVRFGDMPVFHARFAAREVTHANRPVGVIWFNTWMVPLLARVDSAVDASRTARGIVLDLRGNQGGVGAMVNGVAGHFTPRPDTLGRFGTRAARLSYVSNPRTVTPDGRRVEPFTGPVAVLLDELSASASEVFAGGLQALGRVRVFGSTSLGAVLPAAWTRLPNGDLLYHAIGDFRTTDGTLLEGRGVVPDEPVALTRDALLAGRDPVLEAALDWIARHGR
jgi:carboxyl-terminal processing protease